MLPLGISNKSQTPGDMKIDYYDGHKDNIFRAHGGLGMSKYPVEIDFDLDCDVNKMIAEIRKLFENFEGHSNDFEISECIIKNYPIEAIIKITKYCSDDYLNGWINALESNEKYKVVAKNGGGEIIIQSSETINTLGHYCTYNPCIINRN